MNSKPASVLLAILSLENKKTSFFSEMKFSINLVSAVFPNLSGNRIVI